jgi:hypothetical protein
MRHFFNKDGEKGIGKIITRFLQLITLLGVGLVFPMIVTYALVIPLYIPLEFIRSITLLIYKIVHGDSVNIF